MKPTEIVLLSCAALSVTCSLLTLWTIFRIKRWNGYIHMIVNLALAQMMYDLSMVLVPFDDSTVTVVYVGWRCIFGLAATFWTNIISCVIAYAVWYRRAFEVAKSFKQFYGLVYIPSIIVGSMVAVSIVKNGFLVWAGTYYSLRVISIVINIIIYFILSAKLVYRNRDLRKSTIHKCADPLEALVTRFKYYPFVQVISRVAVAFHELTYGYSYSYDHPISTARTLSLYLYVVTLPSLGLLYFIVFLSASPGAAITLKSDVSLLLSTLTFGLLTPADSGKHLSEKKLTTPLVFNGESAMPDNLRSISAVGPSVRVMHSADSTYSDGYGTSRLISQDYYYDCDEQELTREICRLYGNRKAGDEGGGDGDTTNAEDL
jgi:hypothetical protein